MIYTKKKRQILPFCAEIKLSTIDSSFDVKRWLTILIDLFFDNSNKNIKVYFILQQCSIFSIATCNNSFAKAIFYQTPGDAQPWALLRKRKFPFP